MSTRIPGLFLESCFPAHTCLACTASWGYSIPEGDSGACGVSLVGPAPQHPQNQQGWAGAVMGSARTLRSPGWSAATGLPVGEPRGPICRSVPSAQDTQLKATPDGCNPSTAHLRHPPPIPRGHSWLHRHGASPKPSSQTSGVGEYTQSPDTLHRLVQLSNKDNKQYGSSIHP